MKLNSKKQFFTKTVQVSMLMIGIFLMGCSPNIVKPKHPTALSEMDQIFSEGIESNRQAQKNLPIAVQSALLPTDSLISKQETEDQASRFDLSVEEASAKFFFKSLVKGTSYNMLIDPAVHGRITLSLKNVTILEVLAAVHDLYGFQYQMTPYGFHVLPPGLESRIFYVNYLNVQRLGQSRVKVSSGDIGSKIGANGESVSENNQNLNQNNQKRDDKYEALGDATSSVTTRTENNFWSDLKTTLHEMMKSEKGASVIINPEAGMVIVHARTKTMNHVANYLNSLQNTMERQVIIEAKILEVRLNNGFEAGIDWNILGAEQAGQENFSGSTGMDAGLSTSIFRLTGRIDGDAFRIALNLLSTQGNVQVLSSPRVSTLNNQKAVIKVGDDEFFVTSISTSTLATTGPTEQTQDVKLTPFFSGIALDVTPQVDSSAEVTLHIHPVVSRVRDDNKVITLGNRGGEFILPMAISSVRESDSIVRAKSGQVVAVGGLMERTNDESIAKIPLAGDAPFFGSLFRQTKQSAQKTELVILLKPTVIENHTWNHHLSKMKKRYTQLHRGFHYGGQPDVFGTEAEASPSWKAQKAILLSK